MKHISTTPFGRRPVTAGLLAAQALARTETACAPADKWQILRDLGRARRAFGVTDRDLVVLSALLSFHPGAEIGSADCIVFPSNATLGQRAHGMPESTLRRHLAALVVAGLILRHDSPNGKRYAVRGFGSGIDRAYGFDLAPLAHRASEIASAARAADLAARQLQLLRETVVLQLRDCAKLLCYATETLPGCWNALLDELALARRLLRRRLDMGGLERLANQTANLRALITEAVLPAKTEETGGTARENERHIQDSDNTHLESEYIKNETENTKPPPDPHLPLHLVLRACPEILVYAPHGIADWRDLIATASFLRGMLGISEDTWKDAQCCMTPAGAAITLACMLQGFNRIKKPGAYLRSLSMKAQERSFSPAPMVMALLRAENRRPV